MTREPCDKWCPFGSCASCQLKGGTLAAQADSSVGCETIERHRVASTIPVPSPTEALTQRKDVASMLPTQRAARALIRRTIETGSADPIRSAVDSIYVAAMALDVPQVHREPVSRPGFTVNRSRKVWDRDGWECVSCGSHVDLTVDHVVPASRGGSDDLSNLQTMCRSCNARKGAR